MQPRRTYGTNERLRQEVAYSRITEERPDMVKAWECRAKPWNCGTQEIEIGRLGTLSRPGFENGFERVDGSDGGEKKGLGDSAPGQPE